jgi:hypothetical protein
MRCSAKGVVFINIEVSRSGQSPMKGSAPRDPRDVPIIVEIEEAALLASSL